MGWMTKKSWFDSRFISDPKYPDWLGPHAALYSLGTEGSFLDWQTVAGVCLAIHLVLVAWVRMSGAIPSLSHML